MLELLAGNQTLRQHLQKALRSGKLGHSILLCGEAGTGVNYAARCLAADYLYPDGGAGAAQVMAGESPEYLVLEGEGASGEIKIARVREVRSEVYHTALSAQGRVVHIRGAHRLNVSSANALLKVLEEPPEGVLFLLTAPDAAALLPTLLSRCNVYAVSPVSAEECEAYLKRRFPRAQNAAELSALLGGCIGEAQRIVTDSAAAACLDDARTLVRACAESNPYGALCVLSHYEKDRAAARLLLHDATQVCAASLRGLRTDCPAVCAARLLPCLSEADKALAASGNQKLTLAVLAAKAAAK